MTVTCSTADAVKAKFSRAQPYDMLDLPVHAWALNLCPVLLTWFIAHAHINKKRQVGHC